MLLPPLETLYAVDGGVEFALPPELGEVYGRLAFPLRPDAPYVVGNFVTTLDGVVSLGIPGMAGGGEISGFNPHDRLVMGLLRAVADAVIVGAGTLRDVPRHVWTAEVAYPAGTAAFEALRAGLGKSEPPLNVIVTARGQLDLSLRLFQSALAPVLIATTREGAQRLEGQSLPAHVRVAAISDGPRLSAGAVVDTVMQQRPSQVILTEGGPQLIGDFLAEGCLDELFLTLAPQVAGREAEMLAKRPGLVLGKHFAPERPIWGTLVNLKRAGSHLFMRYAFRIHG